MVKALPDVPVVLAVKGVSLHQDAVRSLKEKDTVVLTRDVANSYDTNAVMVKTLDGRVIGYVPASVAPRLAAQSTERWTGYVTDILTGGRFWGVRIKVKASHAVTPYVPEDPVPVTAPEEAESNHVYSLAGRDLGLFVRRTKDSNEVLVKTKSGATKAYPASRVSVTSQGGQK